MDRVNNSHLELNKRVSVYPEIMDYCRDGKMLREYEAVGWDKEFKEQAVQRFVSEMQVRYPAFHKNLERAFPTEESRRIHLVNGLFGHLTYARLESICNAGFNKNRVFIDPYLFDVFHTVVPKGLTIDNVNYSHSPMFMYFPKKIPVMKSKDLDAYVSEVCILPTFILRCNEDKNDSSNDMLETRFICYLEVVAKNGNKIPAPIATWNLETVHILHRRGVLLTDAFKNEFSKEEVKDFDINDESSHDLNVNAVTKIIINTILYYTSNDSDILKQINPDYEKSLRKLKTQTGVARKRRQERLKSIPKNEYFVLGSTLELFRRRQELDHPDTSPIPSGPKEHREPGEPTGRKLPSHVRSGHWRWVACGKGLKDHKLRFIKSYVTHGFGEEVIGMYVTS
jgi:hypothetical protein